MGFQVPQITSLSQIDYGLPISPNFLLEHLTTGAFHTVLGKWVPQFPALLNPAQPNGMFSPGVPLLQIVQSLQSGANGILEQMFSGMGGSMILNSGFLNNIPSNTGLSEVGHMLGQSFDIAINGMQDNPISAAKDIQKLAVGATTVSMVYGRGAAQSYFHIDFSQQSIAQANYKTLPNFQTVDLAQGIVEQGAVNFRGWV
jgi:hypothetical protein